ncbi:MAG: ASKHA domain-containing protein [Candidatus Omnitrophica bacterium]|nr:ASKHA domain-containing protein [Candidatus Omnitrophota bacterium]
MEKYKVRFYPDNKSVEVAKDTTILSAAISCGVSISSVCGGDGVCGRCKVIVKSGKVTTQPSGVITPEERRQNVYLACLANIHSDLEVEILPESKLELNQELKNIYVQSEEIELKALAPSRKLFKHSPLANKLYLKLSAPTLNDSISDLERLYRKIREVQDLPVMQTGLANIRQLGELLRDSEWKVTVTLGKRNDTVEIVLVEPRDTSGKNFGVCFDIGTTTISGQLVDLNTKKVLGTKATYNKQASFGSDVISRIIYARNDEGLEKLHSAVTETINHIIKELAQEHNVDLNNVTCIVSTGNTTMIHLLLRIDPTYIRRDPYVPTANFLPVIRASEAGININPRGLLSCVPGVASYVGGDTTSGVLSSALYKEKDLSILIDIGTNGEIALGNQDFLVSCAASAGPAFEGSGVTCGMRASSGAIQKVKISPKDLKVTYTTIGLTKPRGICGSGYIDLLAELLASGVIDKSGKIKLENNNRVRTTDSGREFIVAFKEETDGPLDIVISEADIENLKRAKAAIYSATSILVKHMNFNFSDVKKIFIAGGFGTYLDMESAIRIGLLPDLERKRFFFIGNSALAGAREILLSVDAQKTAEEIARKITYFELSVDSGYMDEYMAALFFPHTDLNKFPSLKG